ncbi:hypothetical protein [Methylobacterium durans]|uniref:hypothetical protein n=1 Tax=Methylobacterium durans TaxID=2202825 RepID=UPI0013A5B7D4|nr:hypothetical protein [Methylobacterium durans]
MREVAGITRSAEVLADVVVLGPSGFDRVNTDVVGRSGQRLAFRASSASAAEKKQEGNMSLRTAKSPEEVLEILSESNIFLDGMGKEKLERFISSISMKKEGLAHFYYQDAKAVLCNPDFDVLLNVLGTSSSMFLNFRDYSCDGDLGRKECVYKRGYYCNPRNCHAD